MSAFIARMIMMKADVSIEAGQEHYRAYFVKTPLYLKWQSEVDIILETEGYGECIVAS